MKEGLIIFILYLGAGVVTTTTRIAINGPAASCGALKRAALIVITEFILRRLQAERLVIGEGGMRAGLSYNYCCKECSMQSKKKYRLHADFFFI